MVETPTAAAIVGGICPTSRPDIDNYLKSAMDAINGIVVADDSLVVKVTVEKKFGVDPKLVLLIDADRRLSLKQGGVAMSRIRLPDRSAAESRCLSMTAVIYRATFGCFAMEILREIFLDAGKPDAAIQMHADDAAVLVSLLLQHGVSAAVIRRSISGPISRALDLWIEDISHEH